MKTTTCFLITALTTLSISGHAAAGDWLDVRAHEVRIVQGGATIKEGQSIQFDCSWHLDFADDHSYWSAKKTERFPISLEVDAQVLLKDEGVVAQGTVLERPDGGFSSGLKGTSKPATWIAKGVGQHRLFCSVNKPKGISDQYPGNNEKYIFVTVLPEYDVKKGQSWPSATGDSGKAPDNPSARKIGPSGTELPGAGTARMSKPKSKASSHENVRALNPQPEVPSKGSVRALNPQPEVPSKPDASDKKKSKDKKGQRTLPPKY